MNTLWTVVAAVLGVMLLGACGVPAAQTGTSQTSASNTWQTTYDAYYKAMAESDTTTMLANVIHVNGMTDEQLYPIAQRYTQTFKDELAAFAEGRYQRVKVEEDGKFVTVYDRVSAASGKADHCAKTQLSRQDDGRWLVMDWTPQATCPS